MKKETVHRLFMRGVACCVFGAGFAVVWNFLVNPPATLLEQFAFFSVVAAAGYSL